MGKPTGGLFKDKEHLVRMAGIFAIAIVAFFVLQRLLVPDSFGRYGHYRASAIDDARAKPLSFAGRASCARCHTEQAAVHHAGPHARLGCEACHGASMAHTQNPASAKGFKPDTAKLCPVCHAMNVARPSGFKQVEVQDHAAEEACGSCHQPHDPRM